MFLALPSNCPTDPDGSARSTDGQTKADSVVLYASADEAQTFEQVWPKPDASVSIHSALVNISMLKGIVTDAGSCAAICRFVCP